MLQIERIFLMGMIQLVLSLLLYCSSMSRANDTIVNNIWCICFFFTAVLFFFFYQKKITRYELIACLTIMLFALLIGFGGL